jgi:flagellar protein FliS
MLPNYVQRYQAVQITTSSPGELLLAMFDGLFKFLNQARFYMDNGKRGPAGEAVSRAHAILSELMLALDASHAPELCANLTAVYDFCMSRVLEASRQNDAAGIVEALRVLAPIREAFQTVIRGPVEPGSGVVPVGLSELR